MYEENNRVFIVLYYLIKCIKNILNMILILKQCENERVSLFFITVSDICIVATDLLESITSSYLKKIIEFILSKNYNWNMGLGGIKTSIHIFWYKNVRKSGINSL